MKKFWLVSLVLFTLGAQALELKVRLFSEHSVQKAVVTTDSGLYHLIALTEDYTPIDTVYDVYQRDPLRTFYFKTGAGGVRVNRGRQFLGEYPALLLVSGDPENQFRIDVAQKGRAYFGDLRFARQQGELQIVNQVDLEKYVAGVVESEAGHVEELEFYKAQAVLARTFAVRNLDKHADEGYNLKDDVSSQVYFSKAHYVNHQLIDSAVMATRDTVLVLSTCEPILGVFHANSGGMTSNSEDVWSKPLPYLRSLCDSFSVGVGSYYWEKRIPEQRFFDYFARMLGVNNDLRLQKALLNFDQHERDSYFEFADRKLKLTRVRRDLNLRSTYFLVEREGNEVVLQGYGYGHGVGLSQDGAINMSSKGYAYRDILHYYFREVELESVKRLGF